MEWLEGLNKALDYIEDHLDGEIDPEQAAKLAACSVFHFQRMFAYITGVTLTEYIRRRRMTAAALELIGGARVMDLALKYGYESPTAFNRAFQSVHGAAPSAAKAQGISLTAFPRLTFTLSVKGAKAMNYRIETKDAFRVVGFRTAISASMEESFKRVPEFWDECEARMPELLAIANGKEPGGILGLCSDGEACGEYYIAVCSDAPVPAGMTAAEIPAGTWAVFECVGPMPDSIQQMQKRILTEWLPSSGYQYANAPDVEVYPAGDQSAADYLCYTWLPVTKK
ncbi:MAG: AraC family transcriptional regulator [Oscillibacter sp.]|jgi:AraC family transcriptional regulator|nr:AraC family transcriptional regulator [Oscillibacter sp.]